MIWILKWLLPEDVFHVFELECWLQVAAIAKYLDLLFRDDGVDVWLAEVSGIVFVSNEVVYLQGQKSSEEVLVHLVQSQGTPCLQYTLRYLW